MANRPAIRLPAQWSKHVKAGVHRLHSVLPLSKLGPIAKSVRAADS